ncbi:MAG: 16S rRNA (adenine(1518)-N(6)/adenine(1519)-N(6))-dimethyltransferase RsmA [Bacteroidales bacterium]|nr:16S rRNA (adenine(1518)-N(6)/adenine(1519)-N(6))-dimethyltransferase RsmA [Bacteroidales bacterium]
MIQVRPKKNLGQHFLNDLPTAERIVETLTYDGYNSVLEVGPGMGVLTDILLRKEIPDFRVIEIDNESFDYLIEKYPDFKSIIRGDFLTIDISSLFDDKLAIIGNFPYNISSQILFKTLDYKDKVVELCGMFQKEVAERICASPGSKTYGIISVLLQAFYNTEYLFTVDEYMFTPPPKVKSGVIRIRRNGITDIGCDEKLFKNVVKSAFNQRRKTLRNSIRSAFDLKRDDCRFFNLRPEQLSVEQFIELTNWIDENKKNG